MDVCTNVCTMQQRGNGKVIGSWYIRTWMTFLSKCSKLYLMRKGVSQCRALFFWIFAEICHFRHIIVKRFWRLNAAEKKNMSRKRKEVRKKFPDLFLSSYSSYYLSHLICHVKKASFSNKKRDGSMSLFYEKVFLI